MNSIIGLFHIYYYQFNIGKLEIHMKFTIYLLASLFFISGNVGAEQKLKKKSQAKPVALQAEVVAARESVISGQVFIVTKGRESIKLGLVEVSAIPENDMLKYIKEKKVNAIEEQAKLKHDFELVSWQFEQAKQDTIKAKENLKLAGTPGNETRSKNAYNNELSYKDALNIYQESKKYEQTKMSEYSKLYTESHSFNLANYYLSSIPPALTKAKTDADGKFSLTLPAGKFAITASSHRLAGGSEEEYYWLVWVDATLKDQSIMLSNDNLDVTYCDECIIKKD